MILSPRVPHWTIGPRGLTPVILKALPQVQVAFHLMLCCIPCTKEACRQHNAKRNMEHYACTCLASSAGFLFACSVSQHRTNGRLQAADAPDINIICEKVAFDGVTRFEDRYRLPLGVTVNMTDYSAQLATEVCSAAPCSGSPIYALLKFSFALVPMGGLQCSGLS